MKVLHYCNHFSPVSQTFIYDVILELDAIGILNTVVTNNIVNKEQRPYGNLHEIPLLKKTFLTRASQKVLGALNLYQADWYKDKLRSKRAGLKTILKKQRPQVVHAHFGPAGYDVYPVAQTLNIPLIVSFHGFDAFRLPNELLWKERILEVFEAATLVTVVSELMLNHLINLGCSADKLKVIHVGKKLNDYPFQNEVKSHIKNFISIGRLTEKKGHADVIKAFEQLVKKYEDISLKIIGDGPLEQELQELIIELGLEHNVALLGAVNHNLAKEYLTQADGFILCSKVAENGDQEGIPTVLMEGQALGIPCISTFHSGIPEVFPSQNYWMLAEEGNVASIFETIEELILKPKEVVLNAIEEGRKKIETDFNLATEVSKLSELYASINKGN